MLKQIIEKVNEKESKIRKVLNREKDYKFPMKDDIEKLVEYFFNVEKIDETKFTTDYKTPCDIKIFVTIISRNDYPVLIVGKDMNNPDYKTNEIINNVETEFRKFYNYIKKVCPKAIKEAL